MSDQLKWYVVRAISGKEKKVKQYIDAEINRLGITHLVPQVLIPTEKYYQMRDGKKIAKERNFFPGYVLMEAALDGELEHIIKNINSVIGFLGDKQGNADQKQQVEKFHGKLVCRIDGDKSEKGWRWKSKAPFNPLILDCLSPYC